NLLIPFATRSADGLIARPRNYLEGRSLSAGRFTGWACGAGRTSRTRWPRRPGFTLGWRLADLAMQSGTPWGNAAIFGPPTPRWPQGVESRHPRAQGTKARELSNLY